MTFEDELHEPDPAPAQSDADLERREAYRKLLTDQLILTKCAMRGMPKSDARWRTLVKRLIYLTKTLKEMDR